MSAANLGRAGAARTNPYYQGPTSDHFDGQLFHNSGQALLPARLRDLLRWKLAGQAAPWPARVPVPQARPAARSLAPVITMVGHATLLVQMAGLNILTDPVWSQRAGPFSVLGPRRAAPPGVAFADLPPIDAVLISHNHYDHFDIATLRRLHAAHAPLMVVPLGNDTILRRAVPGARIAAGDWYDEIPLGARVSTILTPARHWSARGVRDRFMALWAGHYLRGGGTAVWFAGDTGYDGGMFRAMRSRLGAPGIALIPIGAYAPRWLMAPQHADPDDAVRIMQDMGARHALGMHWGVFRLTDEAREAPAAWLAAAAAAAGLDFRAAGPGEVFRFGAAP